MREWVIFAGLWIPRASLGYVFVDKPYSAPSIFFFDFMKGLFLCLRFFWIVEFIHYRSLKDALTGLRKAL